MRRALISLVVAGLFVAGSMPTAAAQETGTSFESTTEGSPLATEIGVWTESEEGRTVHLEFGGGHVLGERTTFTARWLSPTTTPGERPRFDGSVEFEGVNSLGERVELTWRFRFRNRGGRWSSWFVIRNGVPAGMHGGGGMGAMFEGGARRSMQFEWSLSGRIVAPTTLRGYVDLRVN